MEEEHIEVKKKSLARRALKWLLLLLLFLLLLIGLLLLLFQIPAVQEWSAHRFAKRLSNQLETEVLIDKFRLQGIDEIELSGVLIRDLKQDTMIYVRSLQADLHKPIQGIIDRKLNVEGLTLSDAILDMNFFEGDVQNNLDQVFKGPREALDSASYQVSDKIDFEIEQDKESQLFLLNEFNLERVKVRNYHEIKGKEEVFFVVEGKLSNVEFDPKNMVLFTDEINLKDFHVDISNFEYDERLYNQLFVDPFVNFEGELEDPFPITLTTKKLLIENGSMNLDNFRKAPFNNKPRNQLDVHHLRLTDINIDADSVYTNDWNFGGVVHQLTAKSGTGFDIVSSESTRVRVTEQRAEFDNLLLMTRMSTMRGDLVFIYKQYPDFRDFENKVRFDFQSQRSEIGIEDLMILSPGLNNNPFFQDNQHEIIALNGRILGYVNNLKGRALKLNVGNKLFVDGLVDIRDFADPDRTRINFNLEELRTDMVTIHELIPKLKLPKQFDEFGNLTLKGEFNGLLKDFIASGELLTDIGRAEFDMNLDFVRGVENAVYDGKLALFDFDLGQYSSDENLGIVSLNTSISSGRGLTRESATGRLSANIKRFDYKGYSYENAKFTGLLDDQLINGQFFIKDDNIDLSFEGLIDIGQEPHLDLTGSLGLLDLKALNLYKKPLFVKSEFDIDIRNLDPDEFTGEILLSQTAVGESIDSLVPIDSLNITSFYSVDSNKVFSVESDILSGTISGKFRVLSLPNYFMNYFMDFNPGMASKLGLRKKENLPNGTFDYDIDINNSSGLLPLFVDGIDTIRNLHVDGYLRDGEGFFMQGDVPNLRLNNAELQNVQLYANAEGEYTNLVVSHDGMKVGKLNLSPLTVFADLESDTLYYVLNEVDVQSFLDQINIEGKMYVHDDLWQTQLYNSALQIFGQDWAIDDKNYLRFGPQKLLVRNLNLSHNEEYINIRSINDDKGLAIELQDLPLDQVNSLINYDKINFSGLLSGNISTTSLKNFDDLNADLRAPDFLINGDDFGEFILTANSAGPRQPVFVDLQMLKGEQKFLGQAKVDIPNKTHGIKGYINSQLTLESFPANIIEYFVTNGLSNTTGTFHGSISGVGPLNDPAIEGDLMIPSSSFKIDILGTTYFLEQQTVHLDSDLIDVSGVELTDRFGNTAQVSGGLTHHNLAKLGFAANLRSDNILILETTKADNDIYYGKCFADVFASFDGTVLKPVIRVNAENNENSSFVINTDTDERSGGLDFILFDFDTVSTIEVNGNAATGVDFTIDMNVNRDLAFQIILDESTRDIIKGVGSGDLIFKYSPAGEISLFGDYVIESGEYLFTYSVGGLVPVNKPFAIRRGSKLQWTDDPYDAEIDIHADYLVSASPFNLISNQLGQGGLLADEAQQKTDVALQLLLRGSMLQPDIKFDLGFPEISGQLKSSLDIELARLRTDETAMQNQAASLIIFRDFANPNVDASASVDVVANTLSEWLSSQVSYYLSGFVSEITSNLDFIDDIQFDIGYRLPSGEFSSQAGLVQSASEVGIGTKIIMFDRRLEATIKGDYVNSQSTVTGATSNFFNANFELDYILTRDRRWRLRAYIKQDQIQTGRRTRGGFGLAWQREYDDLEEYREALKEMRQAQRSEKGKK